jgi:type II secretory pathway pseudopilin PulG
MRFGSLSSTFDLFFLFFSRFLFASYSSLKLKGDSMMRLSMRSVRDVKIFHTKRSGMTLIEVLIATALTMLIMLALAQGFKSLSQGVTAGRSRLTGSDQLRSILSLLRSDLQGLTVSTKTHPQSIQSSTGYFGYYDGPLSDSTAMLFNYKPGATEVEEKLSASRWSDIDDAMMFTAKARDGQWFYGRVPLALMKIHAANRGTGLPLTLSFDDWLTDVTIASEYAEIAWFMRPLNEVGMLNGPEAQVTNNAPYNAYSREKLITLETPVNDVAPVVDLDGDAIPDPDGMPDRVALCRRVLLIRPDLMISRADVDGSSDPQLYATPMPVDSDINSFRYQMRFAYQRSDLSVRKDWIGNRFVLKTNSLSDLQRPENRFAHFCIPFPDDDTTKFPTKNNLGLVSSLPILALTSEVVPPPDLPPGAPTKKTNYLPMTNLAYGNIQPSSDRGFVPAAFCRTNLVKTGSSTYASSYTMEEVVASNVVGFDLRGYDTSAVQFYTPGVDGVWGNNGNIRDAGAPGSDDLIVAPSDPGYAFVLENGPVVLASSGSFVDLAWGIKVLNQLKNSTKSTYTLNVDGSNISIWGSALSGLQPGTKNLVDSLSKSGKFNTVLGVFQPMFDTFTDYYEADGKSQYLLKLDPNDPLKQPIAWFSTDGMVPYGLQASNAIDRSKLELWPDRGIDGIDNNANNVIDEDAERDTSPPFRYALPAIQIKIRVQDIPAGTLQELSLVHNLQGS